MDLHEFGISEGSKAQLHNCKTNEVLSRPKKLRESTKSPCLVLKCYGLNQNKKCEV